MQGITRGLALALVVSLLGMAGLSSCAAANQTKASSDGDLRTYRFKQDKYRRRYLLYTPANVSKFEGARPLVLVIHGGASSDRGMRKLTKDRWHHLADQHGFYVAYPNAIDRLWDFGEGKTSGDLKKRVDDLAYFKRVMDHASARAPIDSSRIFATGISRGGQSSYYLACNAPERVRAVVPVAMGIPDFMENECVDGPPVPIAIMNGTADPQVPYEGGTITVFKRKREEVMSTDETVALWRARNGCTESSSSTKTLDEPGDATSVEITAWESCSGAPVKLYKIVNGGHTWPSGMKYLPSGIVGEVSKDIDAADEAWAFFSQF